MFKIDKKFCKIFKEKNSPVFETSSIPEMLKHLDKYTLKLAGLNYFKNKLCFLNHYYCFTILQDFPTLLVLDDESKLFLLKIFTLYEMMKVRMIKIDDDIGRDNYLLYHKNCDLDKIEKIVLLKKIVSGKKVSGIIVNNEERKLIDSLIIGNLNEEDVFNAFLRLRFLNEDFWSDIVKKKTKITPETMEKIIKENFKKYCNNDPNYIENMKKLFDLEMKQLNKKLDKIYKTNDFKEIKKYVKEQSKPFKYPLKEYFGDKHKITYNCFKNMIDEFKKNVEKEGLKNTCSNCKIN